MERPPHPPKGRLARVLGKLRGKSASHVDLRTLPSIPVPAEAVGFVPGPDAFRALLLDRIATARRRIILVALYLQDDTAGREIMDALYAARRANPALKIHVLVDWHRAQRGLIGKAKAPGNAAMYQEYASRFGGGIHVLGVPVQRREIFGVLHLKGFVIDDAVLYSGASLNDVYLARQDRYRLDRYHLFESAPLAACLAEFVRSTFLDSPAVLPLNKATIPATGEQAAAIRAFRRELRKARFLFEGRPTGPREVAVTPLVGLGGTENALNDTILALLKSTQRKLAIYTPYFNLPGPVRRVVSRLLSLGREVTIVVGDKAANDFFIPPDQPFRTIGLLPYLYEGNLRRFAKAHREHIAEGRLNIHLWRHGSNSYHAKGLLIDDQTAVLTGNNLNPRAWALDLEDGLVVRDPHGLLMEAFARERTAILEHTTRLASFLDLETPKSYPPQVQKALKRLSRVRLDRLVNRLL